MNEKTEKQLINFFEKYSLIKYKSKETIYRPQEIINQVAFVKKGYVRIFNQKESEKEITFSGFKPVFLMSYLFSKNKIRNQYYFQALTNIELWKAPIDDFDDFLVKNPDIAIDLIDVCLGSLHEVLLSWENSLRGDAYNRIGKLLLILVKDYGKTENNKITIDFRTTHQLIASMLGISRETASIQIKKMENDGLILQQSNTIIINDTNTMTAKFSN